MKTIVHKADSRGRANFGWLDSHHTFSFGQYYNHERIQFGMLRVLNDDVVVGGAGFPTHPHSNMEIVSIPLSGALAHKDSTGNQKIIKTGEVQIMSAGSGLTHSEYNANNDKDVNFLQLWILPKEKNIEPRYDQKVFTSDDRKNKIQNVVSPTNEKTLWINQDAWLSLLDLDEKSSIEYEVNLAGNGVYVFIIEGEALVAAQSLKRRDAVGIWETDRFSINASEKTKILFIEVPMN